MFMKVKRFQFHMFSLSVNCYILIDEKNNAVIIDPGAYYPEEKEQLKNYIINERLNVEHVIITHLHFDHVCGLTYLYNEFGFKAEANVCDENWYEKVLVRSRKYGIEMPEEPILFKSRLKDGDTVTFGKTTLECIWVPGHSQDSLAYYQKESGCIFVGDVLLRGSIGRTDVEGGDIKTLYDSIVNRLFTFPDDTVLYTGHGESTTIGFEKSHIISLK